MALRIEGDVDTTLSGEALAALLRGVAAHYPHEFGANDLAAFGALADTIAEGHRPAPDGTRGVAYATAREGDGPMVFRRDDVADLAALVYEETRRLTPNPGALLEVQVSVVIASADDAGEECDE
jgi:hypothetical protein